MKLYKVLLYLTTVIFVTCEDQKEENADKPSPNIIHLNSKNFHQLVTGDDTIWLVEFITSSDESRHKTVEEFYKAATALRGVAKFAIINAKENKELARKFNVETCPSFRIISERETKSFTGRTDAKDFVNSVLSYIKERAQNVLGQTSNGKSVNVIEELTDYDFNNKVLTSPDPWLVMFYAPWCGHCQNFKPQFSKAAKKMGGKVRFGAVDATIHKKLADEYQVKGYPTVLYFPAEKKSPKSAVEYTSGRSVDNIVDWLHSRLAEDITPPDIKQIINSNLFEEGCAKKQLCLILFVPDILDCSSSCRKKYLDTVQDIGYELKARDWGWLWSEANVQGELEKVMDVGGFGYPALAVLNSRKLVYSVFRGSFGKKPIQEFLKEVGWSKTSPAPLRGGALPKIVDVAPWNGGDTFAHDTEGGRPLKTEL